MDSWSVFFCLAKCFDMYQIQLRQKEKRSSYATKNQIKLHGEIQVRIQWQNF